MLVRSLYKAPKGLIRVELEIVDNIIKKAKITGDFFMIPETALQLLEARLLGVPRIEQNVTEAVANFYKSGVITPMLGQEDLVRAIIGAQNGG